MPFPAAMPFLMLLVEEAHDSPLPGAASADTVAIITVAITVAIIATIAIITAAFATTSVDPASVDPPTAECEATPARPSSCAASIFAGNRLSSAVSSKRRVAKFKRIKRAKPALVAALCLPELETIPELCEDESDDDELKASEEAISPNMVPREAITPPPLCVNSFVAGKQSCLSCTLPKRDGANWTVAACKHGFCTECFDMLKASRGSQCPDCEAPIGTPKKLSFS